MSLCRFSEVTVDYSVCLVITWKQWTKSHSVDIALKLPLFNFNFYLFDCLLLVVVIVSSEGGGGGG